MRKAILTLARAGAVALAAGLIAAAAPGAFAATQTAPASNGNCGSSAGKCFSVAVSPSSVAAGASGSFAFSITNEALTQQLGAVEITAPSGFTITGAAGSGTALFLNLSIAPLGTQTLTVDATAPCGASSYRWKIVAKQSNNFQGPPGNDYQMDPASAAKLSGTVTGACSLAFTGDGQPAGTTAGTVITPAFDNTQGGPVKVEVLDGSGHLIPDSTAPVTVTIGSNPGSGTLSGGGTLDASGGIASFTGLSISNPGLGYTLTATSPGITTATSQDFTIWGSLGGCSKSLCSASSSSKTTTGTVTTSSATAGQLLGIGLGGVSYSCGPSYRPVSDPVSFDVLSSAGVADGGAQFSASLEINKATVQSSGHLGASSWQLCYASTSSFTAQLGTSGTAMIGGVKYYTGLLPDCSSAQPAPCVQARNKDNAGDVVISFLASGDPVGRG